MDWLILLEIALLFILPIALILFRVIAFRARFFLLNVVFFSILVIVFFEDWSLNKLGLRADNFSQAIIPYAFFIVLGSLILLLLAQLGSIQPRKKWWKTPEFKYKFVVLSVAQEFIFRVYLLERLSQVFDSAWLIILINAFIFAFMHIIFAAQPYQLVVIFLWGVAFATIYWYYPNLILISIAHIIFNFIVVVYAGVFTRATKLPQKLIKHRKGKEQTSFSDL